MSRCLLKVSTIFCGTVQWLHWLQILGMAKLFAHPFAVSSISCYLVKCQIMSLDLVTSHLILKCKNPRYSHMAMPPLLRNTVFRDASFNNLLRHKEKVSSECCQNDREPQLTPLPRCLPSTDLITRDHTTNTTHLPTQQFATFQLRSTAILKYPIIIHGFVRRS